MFEPVCCTREIHELGGPGIFLLGNTQDILYSLLDEYRERIQLIYLDPPFENEYYRLNSTSNVTLNNLSLGTQAMGSYLEFMRNVLSGCHSLLNSTGSLYLHGNSNMVAHMRLMLDEIFGASNFMNEIIWAFRSGGRSTKNYSRKHDNILFYRKSKNCYFNIEEVGSPRGANSRNHLRKNTDNNGRVYYSLKTGGKTYRYYEDSLIYPSDVWTDIEYLHQNDPERIGFSTQKPEALLKRIILASSREGDIVADLFSGSGTTAAVSSKTGRFFLACDSSPFGLYALRKRQYEAHNTLHLLHKAHPLELRFPSTKPSANINAHLHQSAGFLIAKLNSYKVDEKDCKIIHCALGVIEEGSFYPKVFLDSPTLPASMKMPISKSTLPILQTMDVNGIQGFWALETSKE